MALRRTTSSNAVAVSSIIAHSSPGRLERDRLRRGGQAVGQAEGVGETPGRVDRHDDRAAATARCLQPDHRGRRRLADPARAAADDDLGAVEHTIEHRGRHAELRSAAASASMSPASRPATGSIGRCHCARASCSPSRSISVSCTARRARRKLADEPEHAGGLHAVEIDVGGIGHVVGPESVDVVDDDRTELDADPVLQGVGGLHSLVDRRRLGQRDEHDLAALGIARAARRRRWPGRALDRHAPPRAARRPRSGT